MQWRYATNSSGLPSLGHFLKHHFGGAATDREQADDREDGRPRAGRRLAGAGADALGAAGRACPGEGRGVCSGAATLSTQAVTVGPALACTRAACATMSFETAYLAILAGENTVAVTGTSLALSSPRGRLTFVR